ncbi:hypothetical protein Tco_1356523 [Tanacetum coccineum]
MPTGTPPHDVMDEVAKTIVTSMGAHKAEAANVEKGTSPSEPTVTETKSMAKRLLLPRLSLEAKKKKEIRQAVDFFCDFHLLILI